MGLCVISFFIITIMRIIVAGDFCPQYRVSHKFNEGDFASVLEDMKPFIERADYSIVNFECPVTKGGEKPIVKQGPNLQCPEIGIEAVKWVGFDCVTLANNHFLDYGEKGVSHTLGTCEKYGVDTVGGGMNLQEASQVLFKEINGEILAVINCCEHEFSIATDNSAGSNPLSPITQYYQIIDAKQKADFVIVIVHGGIEHCQYPTKRMVETYRFFVDAGADAVINHHQHCPCGYEFFKGKPIYYGLGNFCFDWEGRRNSIWNLGYMVKLNLEDNHQIKSEIIPYSQCDEEPVVRLLRGKELERFNMMMDGLCLTIRNESLLDKKIREFNKNNDYLYRKMLEPYTGRFASSLFRKGILPTTINKERILALMDFVVCESHYERVKEFLERQYNQFFYE